MPWTVGSGRRVESGKDSLCWAREDPACQTSCPVHSRSREGVERAGCFSPLAGGAGGAITKVHHITFAGVLTVGRPLLSRTNHPCDEAESRRRTHNIAGL